MKKQNRVLKLSKETLRSLNENVLTAPHGGQTGTICSNVTDSCGGSCDICPSHHLTCDC